jgi:hypothetical protein
VTTTPNTIIDVAASLDGVYAIHADLLKLLGRKYVELTYLRKWALEDKGDEAETHRERARELEDVMSDIAKIASDLEANVPHFPAGERWMLLPPEPA